MSAVCGVCQGSGGTGLEQKVAKETKNGAVGKFFTRELGMGLTDMRGWNLSYDS